MKKRLAQTRLPGGRIVGREWLPEELFVLYMRGWKDGAYGVAMRKEYDTVPEYDKGYEVGYKAKHAAAKAAGKHLKHKPNILRLAGKGKTP